MKTRILIVDDREFSRYLLDRVLKGSGYEVEEASNGREALEKARQNPPHLIISDLLMPVMDGYTLLRHWRDDVQLRHIPFIVYTATYVDPKDEQLALGLGADAFLLKPSEPADLVARVKQVLASPAITSASPEAGPSRTPADDETTTYRKYSEALIRKLEDKMQQLDRTNRQLQQDVAHRTELMTALEETQKLRDLAECMGNVGGWEIHIDTGKLTWTEMVYRIHEVDSSYQPTVQRGVAFYAPTSRPLIEQALKRATDLGESFDLDLELITAKGNLRNVHVIGTADLKRRTVFGFFQDITRQKQVEKTLRTVSSRQEAILESVPDLIMEVDNNKVYTWANKVGLAFFGDDVIGREAASYFEGEQATYETVQPLFDGQQDVIQVQSWQRRKDGEKRLLAWQCRALKDENGAITGVLSSARDITEHQQSEEVLAFLAQCSGSAAGEGFFESLARYLARSLEMEFVCIDRLEGDGLAARTLAVLCDGRFEDNVTYALKDTPCGEVAGKTICCFPNRVCQSFPKDTVLKDLRAESYVGVTLWGHTGRPIGLIAVIGRHPLKNRSHAENTLKLVAVRAAGELERQEAEKALRENEHKYRELVENANSIILRFTCDGRITFLNEYGQKFFGYSSGEILGRHLVGTIVPETESTGRDLRPLMDQIEADPAAFEQNINENICRDGRRVWIAWTNKSVPDEKGRIKEVLSIGTDITERRQLEEQFRQAQKMEAIGQLAGGVAHDFNNILTVIQANAALLMDAPNLSDFESDSARQIVEAAERAAGLIRRLLLFSRKQAMHPALVNLNEAVGNMARMLQRILGEDITLQSNYAPDLPGIRGDVGMIEQVLLNLAVNARDAMPNGGQLTITTTLETVGEDQIQQNPDATPGGRVCLSVRDTGCGIPPEILPHIFEPFFTTKEVGKGAGLGLATVYGIVKQHQGWIDISSQVGKGTTFRIFLPVSKDIETSAQPPSGSTRLPGGNEVVLLVEDEPAVRILVSNQLKRCGHTVLQADSGVSALEVWQIHKADIQLLLTDMVMPGGLTGRELAEQLKKEKPDLKVICSSGYSEDVIDKAVLPDWIMFLQKPYSPSKLMQTVRECLDRNSPLAAGIAAE
jgi:PAS domain S-box-containing protein